MARKKQCQNIDNLIQGIEVVIKSRCSLSERDIVILTDALNLLRSLKKKKGRTNEQILQCVVEIVVLLSRFLKDSGNTTDEMKK